MLLWQTQHMGKIQPKIFCLKATGRFLEGQSLKMGYLFYKRIVFIHIL